LDDLLNFNEDEESELSEEETESFLQKIRLKTLKNDVCKDEAAFQ